MLALPAPWFLLQGLTWRLRAECSQAAVYRIAWHAMDPPIGFTAQQQPQRGTRASRPTPCTADGPLPLEAARRLVLVRGTGRGSIDGVRRTLKFSRKAPTEFELGLEEQETEGMRGQIALHAMLDKSRVVHSFKLEKLEKVETAADGNERSRTASLAYLQAALPALGLAAAPQAAAAPPAHQLPQPGGLLAEVLNAALGSLTLGAGHAARVEVLEDRTDENFGHCTAVHGQLHSRISQLEKGHKEHTERFSLFDFRLQQCELDP